MPSPRRIHTQTPGESRDTLPHSDEEGGPVRSTGPGDGPFAVIQEGLGLLATGRTLGEAALETARYLDEDVETVLMNLTQRSAGRTPAYGEVYVVRCTDALRKAHDAQGLDTAFEECVQETGVWAGLPGECSG